MIRTAFDDRLDALEATINTRPQDAHAVLRRLRRDMHADPRFRTDKRRARLRHLIDQLIEQHMSSLTERWPT